MAEPTSTTATTIGLYSLFITLFGVVAGEYALIIFASLAGSLWAVGGAKTKNKWEAGWLLLKIVLMAVVLSGGIATFIEAKLGWSVKQVIAPLAFVISFLGNYWHVLISKVLEKFLHVEDTNININIDRVPVEKEKLKREPEVSPKA